MIKNVGLLIFFLVLISSIFSMPLEDLITSENAARLQSSGGFVLQTRFANSVPEFIPAQNELRQFVSGVINTINHNIMVEALYLYRKPEHSHSSSYNWDVEQKTGLFNQLLAISSLEGIEYYSASRKAMRTFFEYSRVIDQPNTKNTLSDPFFTVPPAKVALYARQKDLTFGDNIYLYDYSAISDSIFFVQENVTTLSIGIIPAVGKGKLKTIMAVFDCGDSLLIYGVSLVKSLPVPGMNERISASFSNRAEAVIKWFVSRAEIVFSF